MNLHETNWLPGIVVLAMGAFAAVLFVLFGKKSAVAASTGSELSDDLEMRYQALLGQLKEHGNSKHLMTAEAWVAEQSRLEMAAAQVLREKSTASHEAEKRQARIAKRDAERAKSEPGNPVLKGALIGGGVIAFVAALIILVQQQSAPRVDPPPRSQPMQAETQGEDPKLKQLASLAQRNPEDVDILAQVSSEYLKRQMYNEAVPLIMQATALDPFHVRTRIHRTVLDAVGGQSSADEVYGQLVHLADTYSGAWEARMYAGVLALDLQRSDDALKQLERYQVEAPLTEQPPMMRRMIEMLKAKSTGAPTP